MSPQPVEVVRDMGAAQGPTPAVEAVPLCWAQCRAAWPGGGCGHPVPTSELPAPQPTVSVACRSGCTRGDPETKHHQVCRRPAAAANAFGKLGPQAHRRRLVGSRSLPRGKGLP